jgi:hypothetical protein
MTQKNAPLARGSERGKGLKKLAGESRTSSDYLRGEMNPQQALRLLGTVKHRQG